MASEKTSISLGFILENPKETIQDLEGIKTAVAGLGTTGDMAAQKMTDGFTNIENGAAKVAQKIHDGKRVTEEDLGGMRNQYAMLKQSIDNAYGSLDKAPAAIQAAFQKTVTQVSAVNSTLEKTETAARKSRQEFDNLGREVKKTEQGFTSFGDAFQRMGGKAGSAATQIGLIGGAFDVGWQAGMRMNQFMQVDMTEWDKITASVGLKMGAILKEMADNAVASFGMIASAMQGDKAGIDFYMNELNATQIRMIEAVKKPLEDYKTVSKDALDAEAKRLAQLAQLEANHKATAIAIRDETKALQDDILAQDVYTAKLVDANTQLKSRETIVGQLNSATDQQLTKVQDLILQYGEDSAAVKNAKTDQQQLETSLRLAQQQMDDSAASVADYKTKQDEAAAAIDAHRQRLEELKTEGVKATTEVGKLATTADAVKTAADAAATGIGKMAFSAGSAATGMKDADAAAKLMADNAEAADPKLVAAGNSMAGYATKVVAVGQAITGSGTNISVTTAKVIAYADALERAADAAEKLATNLGKGPASGTGTPDVQKIQSEAKKKGGA